MPRIRSILTLGSMAALLIPATSFALSTSVLETDAEVIQESHTVSASSTTNNGDFLQEFFSRTTATDGGLNTAFDVRAFRSHPCFSAVGEEQNYCLGLFGVALDFETMVEGNSIGRMIVEYALKMRCENLTSSEHATCIEHNATLLPQLLMQIDMQVNTGSILSTQDQNVASENDDDTQNPAMSRHKRAQRLWELCENHEETRNGCYQNFLRFVTDNSVPEAEIRKVITIGSKK